MRLCLLFRLFSDLLIYRYEAGKAEISAIYHENRGRYGYRRITMELH
ncbi:MAG: IS3 family transposase, partial [Lachnospiraceae bacterium]